MHLAPENEAVLLQGHVWDVSAPGGILGLGSQMLEGKSWMCSSMYCVGTRVLSLLVCQAEHEIGILGIECVYCCIPGGKKQKGGWLNHGGWLLSLRLEGWVDKVEWEPLLG